MEKKRTILVAGACACFLAGVGTEHVRKWMTEPVRERDAAQETVRVIRSPDRVMAVRDPAAERMTESLRKRIAELEEALAERDAARVRQPEQAQGADAAGESRGEGRSRRQSWEERMEQMRKDNPEQYAEMQRRREEFRQGVEQRVREREDFLDAVDVAGMTPEQRQNHEQLLATVARVNELMAGMMEGGRPRGEEGEAVRREMGEAMASLGQLYESERRYLLEATAKAAGYTGSDAQAFTEHIEEIYENTSMMPGGGRRGGAPAAGGGGRR